MRRSTCNRLPGISRPLAAVPQIPPYIKSALVKPRAGLEGHAATAQLAEDMRQASSREGGISRDDLELLGWTPAQLDALGAKARQRAQALAGMTV
jgi:hypothetical protein